MNVYLATVKVAAMWALLWLIFTGLGLGLRRLNSSLFEPDTPNQLAEAAVAQYASCAPERFQVRSRPSPKRAG